MGPISHAERVISAATQSCTLTYNFIARPT